MCRIGGKCADFGSVPLLVKDGLIWQELSVLSIVNLAKIVELIMVKMVSTWGLSSSFLSQSPSSTVQMERQW